MKEYLKQWGPEKNQYTWICEQVESQLPEGELKNAIKASIGERKARLATHGGYESPTLTEDGKKYAFRGLNHGTKAIIAISVVLLLFFCFQKSR